MKIILVILMLFSFLHFHLASEEVNCSSPVDPGKCLNYMKRYYYYPKTGKCLVFVYGGCGGNSNNFLTEDECCKVCGDGRCTNK